MLFQTGNKAGIDNNFEENTRPMNVRTASLLTLALILVHLSMKSQSNGALPAIPFEQNPNTTATWHEAIAYYTQLSEFSKSFTISPFGMTDCGQPLHEAIFSSDGDYDPTSIRQKNRLVVMVLNAIHAGEPCGVDASMLLLRDLAIFPSQFEWAADIVLVVVPIYNVGGALNRNSVSRVNQNGPEAYGFRGNARNLDLNRDFIKCDSRNAQSFSQLFHKWQPDLLIDNHTSNGADYAHTMTLLATQADKLTPPLGTWLRYQFLPEVFAGMDSAGWPLTPYVNARTTPDAGIDGFLDLPRYSSGYAALFHTPAVMAEAHMLKPFQDRVRSTYDLMKTLLNTAARQKEELKNARAEAQTVALSQDSFAINWTTDPSRSDSITFMGYEAAYKTSLVSGKPRLYYDREKPWTKKIPYFQFFKPSEIVSKPKAWLIPQAWGEVVDRLRLNGVTLKRLKYDQEVLAEQYRIESFETLPSPWEGHYQHRNVKVSLETVRTVGKKGDWLVEADQPGLRYLVETLEPQAPDSWFCWNFFDAILSQKEHFSAYVFEDIAAQLLEEREELREALEYRKASDEAFRESPRAQLEFIYRNSSHYEPSHRAYPVMRISDLSGLKAEEER